MLNYLKSFNFYLGWKPNTEYRYTIQSKTLTSLHQVSDDYTGLVFKGLVSVEPKTDSHLTIKITEPQYAEVQTTLAQGVETTIPEDQLQYQQMPLSAEPFEVKLKKGVVSNLIHQVYRISFFYKLLGFCVFEHRVP